MERLVAGIDARSQSALIMTLSSQSSHIDALLERHLSESNALFAFAISRSGTPLGAAGDASAIDTRRLANLVSRHLNESNLLENREFTVDSSDDDGLSVHVRLGAGELSVITIARGELIDATLRLSAARTAFGIGVETERA